MWNDLTLRDKARIIRLAVNSGITDLRTIHDVYNKFKNGGQEEKSNTNKLGRIPIIGKIAKDAAYKIITEPEVWYSAGATPSTIIKALTSNNEEDDNKRMFIYGVDRQKTEDGEAYTWQKDIEDNNYGKVESYEGVLNPYNQYIINSRDRGLVEELAKAKYSTSLNINDEYSDPETGFIAKDTPYFDDVHGYRIVFHNDNSGNPVISASDLYDFGKNYSEGFGELYEERSGAKNGKRKLERQRRLLNSVGQPYKLVQKNIPIAFTDNPQGSEIYRANSFTEQVLDRLSDEKIAEITGTTLLSPAVVIANKYGTGGPFGWLRNLLSKDSTTTVADSSAAESNNDEPATGEYLTKESREYFKNWKTYDDWAAKARKEDVANPLVVSQAEYYYNQDPTYEAYYKLINGPYKKYMDLRNQYERADKYMIPFSGDTYSLNSIKNGKPTNKHTLKVDTGLLEYIYNEAVRGGVDPKAAIALAVNESNLGTSKSRSGRAKEGHIGIFDLFSYWHGTDSVLYPNSKVVEPLSDIMSKIRSGEKPNAKDLEKLNDLYARYNHMAENIHEYKGDNVVADATKYFLSGKYPGVAASKERVNDYHNLVMSRFDELMNDKRFKSWWEGKKQ